MADAAADRSPAASTHPPTIAPGPARVSHQFVHNPRAILGAVALVVLAAAAALAPRLAPYPPDTATFEHRLQAPSAAHPLGADHLGRDILSRTLWAARISLSIAALSTLITVTTGVFVGAVSGFFGGWADVALMRLTDATLAFPVFFIAVMFLALFGPSVPGLVFIIGVIAWPSTARLVRAEFLRLKQLDFVAAARALGASDTRLIARHLLPNVVAIVVISATLRVGLGILTEAGLSYLGLGVQPPMPSWGNMVADGREYLRIGWWISAVPGACVFVSVMAFNLIGDGLRDAFDPRIGL
jgi:peptide/nickel transport system permease protein